jgi:hypothetical protein
MRKPFVGIPTGLRYCGLRVTRAMGAAHRSGLGRFVCVRGALWPHSPMQPTALMFPSVSLKKGFDLGMRAHP